MRLSGYRVPYPGPRGNISTVDRPLIVVLGATASGKSDLALHVAGIFHGEIVNYDSVQVYRYFNIGTAKLTPAERCGIPHHVIDTIEPDQLYTAGEFARDARAALIDISARNRVPVLVGGTGFYLRALLEGLPPGHERDESIRSRLMEREAMRGGSLHRILGRLDPQAAARIHANDVKKLIRAIELCLLHRQPASALLAKRKDALAGFDVVKVGLNPPRPALYERINARVHRMFQEGLVEEVQGILARGFPVTAKPFESLGYAQVRSYLCGELTLEEAIALAQQETRRYAKRQMTWFRREPVVHWFGGFGSDPEVQSDVLRLLGDQLL
jgi:tRNA dimethylallyltransferase